MTETTPLTQKQHKTPAPGQWTNCRSPGRKHNDKMSCCQERRLPSVKPTQDLRRESPCVIADTASHTRAGNYLKEETVNIQSASTSVIVLPRGAPFIHLCSTMLRRYARKAFAGPTQRRTKKGSGQDGATTRTTGCRRTRQDSLVTNVVRPYSRSKSCLRSKTRRGKQGGPFWFASPQKQMPPCERANNAARCQKQQDCGVTVSDHQVCD